jgi:hypothetical protein
MSIHPLKHTIMRTLATITGVLLLLVSFGLIAQDRTTVRANNIDISDNLDLRAVAHIFGESRDLQDFENRLNDPNLKISNLDLNNDNQVDYLRVLEHYEGDTHLIVLQAVLGPNLFQDVATIEVEKDRRNRTVQVQVVGDTFLYGNNYIYEPVFFARPIIYDYFWMPNYVAWVSPWHWNFYPRTFWAWNPYPIFWYHNHVNVFVNINNTCHFVHHRRSHRAIAMHNVYRNAGFERQNPGRAFAVRNENIRNRHELNQVRDSRGSSRELVAQNPRSTRNDNGVTRGNNNTANMSATPRNNGTRGDLNANSSQLTAQGGDRTTRGTMTANGNGTTRSNTYSGGDTRSTMTGTTRGNSPASYSSSANTIRNNGSLSSTGNSTPRNTGTMSSNSYSTPRNTGTMSSNSYSTPRNTGTVSSNSYSTPRNTGTMSNNSYSTPRSQSSSSSVSTSPQTGSMSSSSSPTRSNSYGSSTSPTRSSATMSSSTSPTRSSSSMTSSTPSRSSSSMSSSSPSRSSSSMSSSSPSRSSSSMSSPSSSSRSSMSTGGSSGRGGSSRGN